MYTTRFLLSITLYLCCFDRNIKIDSTQLEYFKTITETGLVTKATKTPHISQPTMSAMLKKFEEELNAELSDRTPSRIKLNATGEAAFVHINNILRDIEYRKVEVSSMSQKSLSLSITFYDPKLPLILCPSFFSCIFRYKGE